MILNKEQLDIARNLLSSSSRLFTLTVRGDSMEPTIKKGQAIKVLPICLKQEDIKIGDIIVYKNCLDHFTIHRVIRILRKKSKNKLYITKGDNNKRNDRYIVSSSNIVAIFPNDD